jgi:hypothetical protein
VTNLERAKNNLMVAIKDGSESAIKGNIEYVVEAAKLEIWNFIEHLALCPMFDGLHRDPDEARLNYYDIGTTPFAGSIRAPSVRMALEEFAKALKVYIP